MMTQTVLYFTDSSSFGGAERVLLQLLEGMDRSRWSPVLAYHSEAGLSPLIEGAARLDVRLVEVPRLPLGLEGARRVPSFTALLHTVRPAVFHAHLSWPLACKWGLVAALLGRVPAVTATVHLWVKSPYTLSARIQQRWMAAGVGRYIAVSQAISEELVQVFHIPAHKLQVIHNAVDLGRYASPAVQQPPIELARYQQRPVVLTVARLDKQKGHITLLEAAAQIQEAVFVLVGDGPERTSLQAICQSLGLGERVIFAGFRSDIPNWLAHCDLFVLPSLYEGLPLSILEAMAAGKPVIASAIPGNDELIVHGESGWLVPPGDAVQLTQALRALLADPALAQRLALAGQARVRKEFSVQTMVQQVEQLYCDLLARAYEGKKRHV
jgi:glycosyltransferase involved in cell wall biosynthesis